MGFCITATNSAFIFYGGYGGFFRLRKRIASDLDKEFGELYETLISLHSEENYRDFIEKVNEILERKGLDEDVLDFLFQPDCGGSISYKTCKKIYDIIKDDNKPLVFTYYAHNDGNDWEQFKEFLLECYSKRRKLRWK